MAQTTTAINACDSVIKITDEGGGTVDISGSANECNMDLTKELGKLNTFGSDYPVRLECKKDAAIALKAVYSTTDGEAIGILKQWYDDGGSRVLTVDPNGSTAGNDRYQFTVMLEKLSIPLKSDDANPILVSADMKPTGTFTIASIAS